MAVEDREFNAATVRAYRFDKLQAEIFKFSLAPTTSNESKTLNLLIVKEAHLADDVKRSNELDPMLVSTGGVTWHIGVGCVRVRDFKRGCDGELPESKAIVVPVDRVIADRRKKYEQDGNPRHLEYEKAFGRELRLKGRQNPEIRRNFYLEDTVEEGNFVSRERLVSCARAAGTIVPAETLFLELEWGRVSDETVATVGMLKDVSAFANTIGGDLIIGVSAHKGIPRKVMGIPCDNPDGLILRITELLQNWIEPRIAAAIEAVPFDENLIVLVIRVQRSIIAPHRVVYRKRPGQFWGRHSNGAFSMDTTELRQAFNLSESVYDRISAFREKRVLAGPTILTGNTKLYCHLIPLDSFTSRLQFDSDTFRKNVAHLTVLEDTRLTPHRFNLDGMMTYDAQRQSSYVQLFRNGIIESASAEVAVEVNHRTQKERVLELHLIARLLNRVPNYVRCLRNLGVSPPVWCFLSFTGMQGVFIEGSTAGAPIDRPNLLLPEIQLNDLTLHQYDKELKPALNMLWNAAGHDRCELYKRGSDTAF